MIEDIEPGRYRTRNGSVVSLSHSDDTLSHGYYWVGSVAGKADLWDRQGGYWSTGDESPWDLVARIPDAAPVDDRIERALRALRGLTQYRLEIYGDIAPEMIADSNGGWVDVDAVQRAVQILEGQE
jgi:hypothetical protein